MKQRIWWLTLLLATSDAAWAINKCTNKDGSVSFQDAPCPQGVESRSLDIKVAPKPAPVVPAPRAAGADPRPAATRSSRGPDVDDPRARRLVNAVADLEVLAIRGRDCREQLTSTDTDRVDICYRWATEAKAQHAPALETLRELVKDDDFVLRYRDYFERGTTAARTLDADAFAILGKYQEYKARLRKNGTRS